MSEVENNNEQPNPEDAVNKEVNETAEGQESPMDEILEEQAAKPKSGPVVTSDETDSLPAKKKSELSTYVMYFIVIVILSYGITYGLRIYSFNKNFSGVAKGLSVPVTEEKWVAESVVTPSDFGTFKMAVPEEEVQLISIMPQNGAVLLACSTYSLQINQPTSAAMSAMMIEKAQKDNPDNEVLQKMAVNGYEWHEKAAKVTQKGYFEYVKMDEVARKEYTTMINYKAGMPVNAEGITIFETAELKGILHRGAIPTGDNKQTIASIQLWDKERDIIQSISMSCAYDNLDKSLEAIKPAIASISYDGYEVKSIVEQVQNCGNAVIKMPKFKKIQIQMQPKDGGAEGAGAEGVSGEGAATGSIEAAE